VSENKEARGGCTTMENFGRFADRGMSRRRDSFDFAVAVFSPIIKSPTPKLPKGPKTNANQRIEFLKLNTRMLTGKLMQPETHTTQHDTKQNTHHGESSIKGQNARE
jgi:hypothetical protein